MEGKVMGNYEPKEYEKVLGIYEKNEAEECLRHKMNKAVAYHEFGFRIVTLADDRMVLIASNKDKIYNELWETLQKTR